MKLIEEAAIALCKYHDSFGCICPQHGVYVCPSRCDEVRAALGLFLATLRREPSLAATDKAAWEIWTRFGVHENWQDVPEAERKTWRNAALACGSAMVAERVKEWGE